jgi:hypothetical protein
VAAAILFAVFVDFPCFFTDFLIFSYCLFLFGLLTPLGGIIVPLYLINNSIKNRKIFIVIQEGTAHRYIFHIVNHKRKTEDGKRKTGKNKTGSKEREKIFRYI